MTLLSIQHYEKCYKALAITIILEESPEAARKQIKNLLTITQEQIEQFTRFKDLFKEFLNEGRAVERDLLFCRCQLDNAVNEALALKNVLNKLTDEQDHE